MTRAISIVATRFDVGKRLRIEQQLMSKDLLQHTKIITHQPHKLAGETCTWEETTAGQKQRPASRHGLQYLENTAHQRVVLLTYGEMQMQMGPLGYTFFPFKTAC